MPLPVKPVTWSHLFDKGLVADEALSSILGSYPEEAIDINAYDFDHDSQHSLRTGTRGDAGGAAILRDIKAGRVWVNMRDVARNYPGLWAHAQTELASLADRLHLKIINATGNLILSSPQTKVPYHFDAAGVVLFHLRGQKQLHVYPPSEAFLPQIHMEDTILRTTTEELPYNLAMDRAASVSTLSAGDAVIWPLYAPHRVDNMGVFNVSLSIEFQTWETRISCGAHYTNGALRRWGYRPPPMESTTGISRFALWIASLGLKRMRLIQDAPSRYERTFALGVDRAA